MTNERKLLKKVTRPLKFRRLRLISSLIKHHLIKLYNIYIYKYNCLLVNCGRRKRFSYNTDNTEIKGEQNFFIDTPNFKVNLKIEQCTELHDEEDYFYTEKNGLRKIKYTLVSDHISTNYLRGVVTKFSVRIKGDIWRSIDPFNPTISIKNILEIPHINTDFLNLYEETYDFKPLFWLTIKSFMLDLSQDEVSAKSSIIEEQFRSYFNSVSVENFRRCK